MDVFQILIHIIFRHKEKFEVMSDFESAHSYSLLSYAISSVKQQKETRE